MELIRRGKDTISLHGCSVVKPHYYKTNKKKDKGLNSRKVKTTRNVTNKHTTPPPSPKKSG
jgi:hypothetical protein